MFFTWLLWLLAILAGDDPRWLASEDFWVREAASRRLLDQGWLALPTLLLAERSGDAEAMHRADVVLEPKRELLAKLGPRLRIGTLWFIYEPPGLGAAVTDLSPRDLEIIEKMPLDWHAAAIVELRRLGLVHQDELCGPEIAMQACEEQELDLVEYVIRARRRAIGVSD